MDWQRALAGLSHGKLSSVYILRGDEHVLAHQFIERIRQRVDQDTGLATAVARYWSDDNGLDEAIRVCQSMQLFGAGDVVVLERCAMFGSSSKVKTADSSMLEQYLSNPVESRVLVITVPHDAWDERKKVTKLAKEHAIIDCTTPKPEICVEILQQMVKQSSINVEQKAISELVRRSKTISQSAQDLAKLVTYAGESHIDVQDVVEMVNAPMEDNIFTWLGFVMEGKAADAFRTISDVLLSGNDVMAVLAMVSRQIRMMWYAVWGAQSGITQSDIARRVGAHPYALKVAATQSRGLSLTRLEQLVMLIADAEFAIKSGRREAAQALDYIVMACLSISQRDRRVR